MDPTSIIGGLTAAAAYGLAIGTSLRLIPTARRASRDLRDFSRSPDGALERERLLQRSVQTKARLPRDNQFPTRSHIPGIIRHERLPE
jgi:hypothetical protein